MNTLLPTLAEVIVKIKGLKELSPEEELVYYTQIENFSDEEARKILANSFQTPHDSSYSYWIS